MGAPEADAKQPGVHKGGAVYKCSVQRPGACQIIDFDKNGNNQEDNHHNDSQHSQLINKFYLQGQPLPGQARLTTTRAASGWAPWWPAPERTGLSW